MRIAGFPSPADEYGLITLSLNELLVPRPTSTFFVRVVEDLAANIRRDDILVIDRSLVVHDNNLVLVVINGEIALRRTQARQGQLWLCALSGVSSPLLLKADDEQLLWGVVTHVIHKTH
jgi:DNA polymerase V